MRSLVLFLYLAKEGFEYFVRFLNLRRLKETGEAPPEFGGQLDEQLLRKTAGYEAEKTHFGFISRAAGNAAAIIFIWGGVLNAYNSWLTGLGLPFAVSGWLFFLLLFYAGRIFDVPFSLYYTFRIENRHGFNRTPPGLWASDFVKSLLISTVVITALAFAGFGLIRWSPRHWWFWVWGFLFVFGVFMMYISPYVIEPLFNKFSPVEDEALLEKIARMAAKTGIRVSRVLKVDASKRSRHSNAYFTGIGRTKRVVLFDTLLDGMGHDEVLAVLAHEMGHWKKRHLLKMLFLFEAVSLAGLWAASRLLRGGELESIFGIGAPSMFAGIVLLGLIAGIVSLPLKAGANYLSRRHEMEADGFARELAGGPAMAGALIKLAKENLSNPNPHPLYVAFNYSHPPVAERIRYLEAKQRKGDK